MMAVMQKPDSNALYFGDRWLLLVSTLLVVFGLVMMTSASIEIAETQYGDAFYHLKRQLRFLVIGLLAAGTVFCIPMRYWRYGAVVLFVAAQLLLVMVLLPGIGREVNGSTRWLNLGFMTIQASEPAKLFLVIFTAWYLSTKHQEVCTSWLGFLSPLLLLLLPAFLLLQEPDFGAVVVLLIAVFGMMFMAGARILQFLAVILLAAGGAVGLIMSSSYRLQRLETFIQALSDPFNEEYVYGSGYQLAQALIAFGRGEWFGVGLGNSIQKIYFLPEAHTDFVFAIIAEELGFLAVALLMLLFMGFIACGMRVGRRSELGGNFFAAYVAYGITFLFSGQILINVAVNIGLLPTKGLTLPFLSYGGSSLIICLVMLAMLLRIDIEQRHAQRARKGA